MRRDDACSTTACTDMSIMKAIAATNPRRRARDKTTSMKPSRKNPRAKEISPTWFNVSEQVERELRRVYTYLHSYCSGHRQRDCFRIGWRGMGIGS